MRLEWDAGTAPSLEGRCLRSWGFYLLRHVTPSTDEDARRAHSVFSAHREEARAWLEKQVLHGSPVQVSLSIQVLAHLAADVDEYFESLLHLTRAEDAYVRNVAAYWLASAHRPGGVQTKTIVARLAEMKQFDADPRVRREAELALTRVQR